MSPLGPEHIRLVRDIARRSKHHSVDPWYAERDVVHVMEAIGYRRPVPGFRSREWEHRAIDHAWRWLADGGATAHVTAHGGPNGR